MLSYISIKNIVLIDKLELNFKKGFTVLTGETGAGKSIIVDAINLLLGNRADRRLIKKGQNEASVSALFSVNQNHEVRNILTKYGLVAENEIIIRRKILSNGRSQSFINDEVISLNIMREVSGYLIEVNGQNDQAGLLDNSNHIKILDIWGNLSKNTQKVLALYNLYKDKLKSYNEYKDKVNEFTFKQKYLIEDLEEINSLALEEDEIDKLIEKKKYLTSIEKIKDSLEKINFLLKGSADSNGIYEKLVHSKKQISSILSLNKELFNKLDESIENTLIEYKETEAVLEECMASIDENNSSLDYIENRISTIKRISRKHNIEENQINSFKNKLENSLNKLADSENELKKRKNDININKEKYKLNAKELTDLRYKASIKLSESINKEFPILKLDNAKFAISIKLLEENNWKSDGMDSVIFKIETNKDSGYDFISKIASGGELSRIMLAIKVSIASEYENSIAKTLIFDEVDTGVGGAVADAVGKRLNLLAKHNQVLAVTHHPQVAARAGNHFKVNKNNINSYSSTSINNLNKAERIEEIARMLSGEKITDAARNAAESLFNHNKNVL